MPADTTQNLACRYLSSLVSCVDIILKNTPNHINQRIVNTNKKNANCIESAVGHGSSQHGHLFKKFFFKKRRMAYYYYFLSYLFATGRLAATCRPLNICLLPVGYAGTL
jgi:hypothetical protein